MISLDRKDDTPVVLDQGIYKRTATTSEAVFMITGMAIGAGVLGVPYVVAQVGLSIGLAYIFFLGLVLLGLNLMIGELVTESGEKLQLPGLAGKYVGRFAKDLVSITLVCRSYGALLAYTVGEGLALSALFGGSSYTWSIIFWSVGSFCIWGGIERVKNIERYLSLAVIFLIVTISVVLLPSFHASEWNYTDFTQLMLPFGVILFALSATPAIAEAHALLPGEPRKFRRAVVWGSLIPVVVYIIFAFAVVGVNGLNTTPVATLGLGERFGSGMLLFASMFAIFAMCTGFMGVGTALRESLSWDHHMSKPLAKFLVIAVPLILFISGFQNFISILEVVGGVFIGIESMVMAVVYTQMKRARHTLSAQSLVLPIVTAGVLGFVAFLTIWQLFK